MPHSIQNPALLRIVERIRNEIDPDFDFVSPGPPPWCPAPASLREAPVALVTTAGLHLKGEPPFRALEDPLGDTTFRLIPDRTPSSRLDLAAPYVDQRLIPQDTEVALPTAALETLHRRGLSGPAARRHASFCGGIVRPLPGLEESAERLAELFREDGARAVILLPSCPLCVQTVCLLARALERRGFPTVCVTLVPELSRIVGAPRSLAVRFRFGAPCGDPGNAALHRAVLREALELLERAEGPGALLESRLKWREAPAY
jgi:hypothetical protein